MALEQQIVDGPQTAAPPQGEAQVAQGGESLSEEEEKDLDIAVMLAENFIDEGGFDVINTALQESKSPGEVIGQFLMQLVSQMSEQMPREFQLSPRIYLSRGGWVEQISDYLQEEYDVPQDVMDKAEIFIAAQADSMSKGAQQQDAGQIAQQQVAQQAPAMPQGGMG